ncbi:MAG: chromate transporter [Azonexus sp.]|jgi:chromate transporter|nr:chromate transporter [Betaproteobacteria bacterium]MBK8916971.1 chromate transporter [Betaproteobacteria bacterium]MBP6036072.1 chromate transporter [Azonexus sp.]MBP6906595.1 chromate transporter [Azonexus sp.]
MPLLAELFLQFALLFCIAFGGATALLPEMQRVVVEQEHWLSEATFIHLYAIAQAAPGPNGLVVTLIGWKVAGLAGALVATLAMCLPMSVVIYFLIPRWERFRGARWQQAVQMGVAPLAVGLVFAGAALIGSGAGLDWAGWVLAAGAVILNLRTQFHPLWFIAAGAAAGLAGWV